MQASGQTFGRTNSGPNFKDIQSLLPSMDGNIDIISFFVYFERVLELNEIDQSLWAKYLPASSSTPKSIGDRRRYPLSKGVYCYSYMTGSEKFEETQLPPIECFHDKLKDEPLKQEDYQWAKDTRSHFGIKTMIAHHYHYLLTDVLLADGFEHFRQAVYKVGLPPHRGAPLSRLSDGVKTHRRRARAHNGSRSVPHDGE